MTQIDAGEPSEAETLIDAAMTRADVFRAAYKLVNDLAWESTPEVLEVTRVAEFLTEGR